MASVWAVCAAVAMWIALIMAYFAAWGFALGFALIAALILALLALDDICLIAGPVSFLRAGRVWSLTIGSLRIWGINWRVGVGKIEAGQ